jgi:hypothetical protein
MELLGVLVASAQAKRLKTKENIKTLFMTKCLKQN